MEALAIFKNMENKIEVIEQKYDEISSQQNDSSDGHICQHQENNYKIKLTAFITEKSTIFKDNAILFDSKIEDPENSFDITTGIFVTPRRGYFTFYAHGFRDENDNRRDLSGTNYGIKSERFGIYGHDRVGSGTTKELQKGEKVLISRDYSNITLGCTDFKPCSLSIVEQSRPPINGCKFFFDNFIISGMKNTIS